MEKSSTNKPKRKRGNPAMVKGGPSLNPLGSAAPREILQKEIPEAIHYALNNNKRGGAREYFQYLADEKPALFTGLMAKVMPAEVKTDVQVNLGQAMSDALTRLAAYEKEKGLIDITPEKPDYPVTIDDEYALENANALKDKDNS